MTDKELINKVQVGDEKAFEELVYTYQHKVYSVAMGMMKNEQDAYDAAQETFIRVFRSIGGLKGDSALFTWIYRITMNVCLDQLRKRTKEDNTYSLSDGEDEIQIPSKDETPEQNLEKNLKKQEVRKAVSNLGEEMQAAIVLRYMKELSYEEIAEVLEVSIGTVKSRIFRARKALKKLLEQNELFTI